MRRRRTPWSRLILGGAVVAWYLVAGAVVLFDDARLAMSRTDIDHTCQPPAAAWLAKLTDRRPAEVRAPAARNEASGMEDVPFAGAHDVAASSRTFALGSDAMGRGIAPLVSAAPGFYLPHVALYVATALVLMLGVGCGAGLYRGRLLGRVMGGLVQVNHSLPHLVVVLAVLAATGFSMTAFVVALAAVSGVARSIQISNKIDTVMASGLRDGLTELGVGRRAVLWRHLLTRYLRANVIVQIPFLVAEVVLFEAGLGYLNHPARASGPTYGAMLAGAVRNVGLGMDWLFVFPALGIVLSIWGFYALGSGLADVFNERNPHSV